MCARADLYRQAEEKLIGDTAGISLWFGRDYILVKSSVKDYTISPLDFLLLVNVPVND